MFLKRDCGRGFRTSCKARSSEAFILIFGEKKCSGANSRGTFARIPSNQHDLSGSNLELVAETMMG